MKLYIEDYSSKRKRQNSASGKLFVGECKHLTLEFKEGIYFLTGECYSGNWFITDFLSREESDVYEEGRVYLDGEKSSIDSIRAHSFYIGEELGLFKKKNCKFKDILDKALKMGNSRLSYEEFLAELDESFELDDIVDRKITQMGHKIWLCYILVGIALGKKIINFPWMPEFEIQIQLINFLKLSSILKKMEIIMLVPCQKSKYFDLLQIQAKQYSLVVPTNWYSEIKF